MNVQKEKYFQRWNLDTKLGRKFSVAKIFAPNRPGNIKEKYCWNLCKRKTGLCGTAIFISMRHKMKGGAGSCLFKNGSLYADMVMLQMVATYKNPPNIRTSKLFIRASPCWKALIYEAGKKAEGTA